MEKTLAGKRILITGGTSALGKAFVLAALCRGAEVFFTYCRNSKEAQGLSGKGAESFPLDLADGRAIENFARLLKQKVKHLDVLVHNAAAIRDRLIKNLSEEDWEYVLNVNLKAPYLLTRELLPLLREEKGKTPFGGKRKKNGSKIFMVVSRAAFAGGVGISNYAAAKAGLIALTKSLAAELAEEKIFVNAVNPGFMKSRMTENLPPEIVGRNLEASLLGRYSDPEEAAEFLSYLCSDAVTQVTGQIFHFESRPVTG